MLDHGDDAARRRRVRAPRRAHGRRTGAREAIDERRGTIPPSDAMLTHFTRASRGGSALDNLVAILREGVLRASSRMVRNRAPVVCLFDAPLSELAGRSLPAIAAATSHSGSRWINAMLSGWVRGRSSICRRARRGESSRRRNCGGWSASISTVRRRSTGASSANGGFAGDLPLNPRHAVALVESWRDVDAVFEHFDGRPPCAGVIPQVFGARCLRFANASFMMTSAPYHGASGAGRVQRIGAGAGLSQVRLEPDGVGGASSRCSMRSRDLPLGSVFGYAWLQGFVVPSWRRSIGS